MTKTAEKPKNAAPTKEIEGFENVTENDLPPLMILDVSQFMFGELTRVDTNKDENGKYRTWYRFKLTKDAEALNVDKDEETFKLGEIITIPGSGSLDYAMLAYVNRVNGVEPESFDPETMTPKWSSLYGREFRIERREDGTLKKGKFAGKKVKQYDVKIKTVKA